jgi:hypothetical protein
MKSMMQQTVPGPFYVLHLGGGLWRLSTGFPAGPDIFLSGAHPDEPGLLSAQSATALRVEWRTEGVKVALMGPNGVRHVAVGGAVIHEPASELYEALPLAVFDGDARRFWRRVFRLMRIPGGRFLLRFLARGRRGKGTPGR